MTTRFGKEHALQFLCVAIVVVELAFEKITFAVRLIFNDRV